MAAERSKTYTTPRTYRFTAGQAYELSQTATLLRIPESRLVRMLLDKGLKEIYKNQIHVLHMAIAWSAIGYQ